MRELILRMSISVDGFVSAVDSRNTWMFGADQEAKAWGVAFVGNASLHIMGSRSFSIMAPYWPTSTDPFAPSMNQIPKAVFSRQGPAILESATTAAPTDAGADARNTRSAAPQPGVESWKEAHVASGDLAQESPN